MLVYILYATGYFHVTVLPALFMIETLATTSEICHVRYLPFLLCRRESIFHCNSDCFHTNYKQTTIKNLTE